MTFLSNITMNLRARGPAAVLITWIICITLVGLFGSGPVATSVVSVLSLFGIVFITSLAGKVEN